MSIPTYLANIKSAGVYRYVFDKSIIPSAQAQSLRLVVGYSEKGPFNTPVYISEASDFINTFGNISRRMERKGVFFHRNALQALQGGPILALNIKPFNADSSNPEQTSVLTFNASDLVSQKTNLHKTLKAKVASTEKGQRGENLISVYDTNRFWKVDAERMHDVMLFDERSQLVGAEKGASDYVRIVQTSTKDDSCTVFVRKYTPAAYNISISDWYSSETAAEMPPYLEPVKDCKLNEFFAEVYVFKGDLTDANLYTHKGTLGAQRYCRFIYAKNNKGNVYWDGGKSQPILESVVVYENRELKTYKVTEKDGEGYKLATGTESWPGLKDMTFAVSGKPSTADEALFAWQPFCKTEDKKIFINKEFVNSYGQSADALAAMAEVGTSNFVGRYAGILLPSFKDANGSFVSLDTIFNADYSSHKMLMHFDEALLDESLDLDANANGSYEVTETRPTTHGNVEYITTAGFIKALASITQEPTEVAGIYIEGYIYNSIGRGDKGENMLNNIMAVLNYKGIYEALTNNIDVDYHYLIDTFQTYPGLSMKAALAEIAKKKDNTLALLNFPPMDDVMKYCGYSRYDGGFDMAEIAKISNNISLPSESQGASWCAFYTQLTMSDGANKFVAPSAALVSNLFMEKYAKRQPYFPVAGANYGLISAANVVGPDYNYARNDLDVLEPMGVNAIIHMPRYGIVINSNQTAKQTPVSALSKVHIRELVIYIQDEIEHMLRGYQWDLNTSTLRERILSRAETILGTVKANGGIYAFTAKCDDENNTPEIIDNEMVILDVAIEPARATGKLVQTLTIHRTGGITTA